MSTSDPPPVDTRPRPSRQSQEAALEWIERHTLTLSRLGFCLVPVVLCLVLTEVQPPAGGQPTWALVGWGPLAWAGLVAGASGLAQGTLVAGWWALCALRRGVPAFLGRASLRAALGPGVNHPWLRRGDLPSIAPAHGPTEWIVLAAGLGVVALGGVVTGPILEGTRAASVGSLPRLLVLLLQAWAFTAGPVLAWYAVVSPWLWCRCRLGVPWRVRLAAWNPLTWAEQIAAAWWALRALRP